MIGEYEDNQKIFDSSAKKNYRTNKSEDTFRGSKYRGVSRNGK